MLWVDLYSRMLSKIKEINPKEAVFTGFIPSICFTKYNDGGKKSLSVLLVNDTDDFEFRKGSRNNSHKRLKKEKDDT